MTATVVPLVGKQRQSVSEPLREDVHGELARLTEALQWVPASRQVWEVTEA